MADPTPELDHDAPPAAVLDFLGLETSFAALSGVRDSAFALANRVAAEEGQNPQEQLMTRLRALIEGRTDGDPVAHAERLVGLLLHMGQVNPEVAFEPEFLSQGIRSLMMLDSSEMVLRLLVAVVMDETHPLLAASEVWGSGHSDGEGDLEVSAAVRGNENLANLLLLTALKTRPDCCLGLASVVQTSSWTDIERVVQGMDAEKAVRLVVGHRTGVSEKQRELLDYLLELQAPSGVLAEYAERTGHTDILSQLLPRTKAATKT
jgi:hypothetical protein